MRQLLHTEFGHAWLWQVGAAVVAGIVALSLAAPKLPFGRTTMWLILLAAALAITGAQRRGLRRGWRQRFRRTPEPPAPVPETASSTSSEVS